MFIPFWLMFTLFVTFYSYRSLLHTAISYLITPRLLVCGCSVIYLSDSHDATFYTAPFTIYPRHPFTVRLLIPHGYGVVTRSRYDPGFHVPHLFTTTTPICRYRSLNVHLRYPRLRYNLVAVPVYLLRYLVTPAFGCCVTHLDCSTYDLLRSTVFVWITPTTHVGSYGYGCYTLRCGAYTHTLFTSSHVGIHTHYALHILRSTVYSLRPLHTRSFVTICSRFVDSFYICTVLLSFVVVPLRICRLRFCCLRLPTIFCSLPHFIRWNHSILLHSISHTTVTSVVTDLRYLVYSVCSFVRFVVYDLRFVDFDGVTFVVTFPIYVRYIGIYICCSLLPFTFDF